MTHLSVLLALEKGARERAHQAVTALHREAQKAQLYDGLSKTYRPKNEDGDVQPPQSQNVRAHADEVLVQLADLLRRPWDLTATRDETNRHAVADVVVQLPSGSETTLLTGVPAVHLLWLEKQLNDLRTFVGKMPVLDPAEQWTYDPALGHHRSPSVETLHTRKVPDGLVLYEATKEHPAQVQPYNRDEVVGTWTTIKYSGALPWDRQRQILDRIDALRDAVKAARERANLVEVRDVREADVLLRYVLDGTIP